MKDNELKKKTPVSEISEHPEGQQISQNTKIIKLKAVH